MSKLNHFLKGLKVLDLTQYLPGPMASLFLADMGAEVTKIEPPSGDEMRRLGPRDAQGNSIFFAAINAGKRARYMDLKDSMARREFLALARDADVLIEGFRPGVMRRLGVDWETLQGINPRLIFCSISGYGQNGPLASTAGHDGNYLAMAGVLARNGDAAPVYFDPPVADTSGALFAVIAILGALQARQVGGAGCHIDLALADIAMPLQLFQVADFGARGTVPGRRETYLNGGAAYYQIYRTADDRHVVLGGVEPKFWTAFCTAAGRADWIARHDDTLPQHELIDELRSFFATLSLNRCLERFAGVDCMLSPVLELHEALQTDHLRARDLVRRAAHGELQALFPAQIDSESPASRPPLQSLGQIEP